MSSVDVWKKLNWYFITFVLELNDSDSLQSKEKN